MNIQFILLITFSIVLICNSEIVQRTPKHASSKRSKTHKTHKTHKAPLSKHRHSLVKKLKKLAPPLVAAQLREDLDGHSFLTISKKSVSPSAAVAPQHVEEQSSITNINPDIQPTNANSFDTATVEDETTSVRSILELAKDKLKSLKEQTTDILNVLKNGVGASVGTSQLTQLARQKELEKLHVEAESLIGKLEDIRRSMEDEARRLVEQRREKEKARENTKEVALNPHHPGADTTGSEEKEEGTKEHAISENKDDLETDIHEEESTEKNEDENENINSSDSDTESISSKENEESHKLHEETEEI